MRKRSIENRRKINRRQSSTEDFGGHLTGLGCPDAALGAHDRRQTRYSCGVDCAPEPASCLVCRGDGPSTSHNHSGLEHPGRSLDRVPAGVLHVHSLPRVPSRPAISTVPAGDPQSHFHRCQRDLIIAQRSTIRRGPAPGFSRQCDVVAAMCFQRNIEAEGAAPGPSTRRPPRSRCHRRHAGQLSVTTAAGDAVVHID